MKLNIEDKIHSVPALMFLPSKEIIFGKAVFDYLLLPNRGFLFSNNSTRDKEQNEVSSSINSPVPLNNTLDPNEPMAFALGSILSDRFSIIDDDNNNSMNINNNKIYNWTNLENDKDDKDDISKLYNNFSGNNDRKTLNLDDYKKQRDLDIK